MTKGVRMAAFAAAKQRGKPFAPGLSGNPRGKAKGTRDRATLLGERILQRDADAIVEAVVAAAKGGDMQAARLCVERLIPLRRGRPVNFPLPKLRTADDVGEAFSAIVEAMARGELTPEEAGAARRSSSFAARRSRPLNSRSASPRSKNPRSQAVDQSS